MHRLPVSLLCTLLLASQSTIAQQFIPRGDIEQRNGGKIQKRLTCEPATPDVREEAVFTDACNENPQNDFNECFNSLITYAQDSALSTCARYYTIYNDCLVANNYSETACTDSRVGYVYCSNYTVQAYAYCGCWFALPDQLYNCANVELQINGGKQFAPAPTASIVSSAILQGPLAPPSATLSNIPQGVPSDVPVFSPRQSSTLVPTTVLSTSTIVTTSCGSDAVSCPAVTYSSTFPVPSSYWACGPGGCVVPPSSLAPPAPVATPVSAVASGSKQSTSTTVTSVPVTRTITTTGPGGSVGVGIYTTAAASTLLSCDGGCSEGPSKVGECVVRKRTRVLGSHEEI
ncbi:MAG: hypothetical protein Q9201_004749 [Fulgogasparrea decipioides]